MEDNLRYGEMLRQMSSHKQIVLNAQQVADDAVLVIFDFDVDFTSSAVIYDDGTIFTPMDWYDPMYPQCIDEISDIVWQLGVTGTEAKMVNGLPTLG